MRIALGLEYCGRTFTGWQSQPDGRGVQDALERALAVIADATVAHGRRGTHRRRRARDDAGRALRRRRRAPGHRVGARRQCESARRRRRALGAAGRFRIPRAIRRRRAPLHLRALGARRCARRSSRDASAGTIGRLDVAAMREAAGALVGTHDFSAFRAAECQAKSPTRTLSGLSIASTGDALRFDFCANAYPPPHDPQHRRRARLRRRGQASAGVDRRASRGPRPHARGADVRRRTGSISPASSTTRSGAAADAPAGRAAARLTGPPMTLRTRVKICGITRVDDALAAARAGADAIGFVFWPGTPRVVALERARAIAAALPPFVTVVGLFVDPDARPRARDARRGAARSPAVPRHGAAGVLPRLRPAATSRPCRSPRMRRRSIC